MENFIWDNAENQWNWEMSLDSLSNNINDWQDVQWTVIWKLNDTEDSYWEGAENKPSGLSLSKEMKLAWRLIVLIVLFAIIWISLLKYDKYVKNYSNWIEESEIKIVSFFENQLWKIYSMFGKEYDKKKEVIPLDSEIWKLELNDLIENKNNWYINKKETIKNSLDILYDTVIKNAERLEEIKKHISAYGFFSDKLSNIISSEEQITSIQDSLTAIRAIKFSSAISVFSKLDTFVESLARETGKSKAQVLSNMNEIIDRWEKDINLYIKNCELNAFEVDYECNNIWDFDKYYELIWDKEFDTDFFKYLMMFIKDKLEQTEIPSFSIEFKWFNQQSSELSFDIVINIQKADKVELAKKWILSPHSFILNSLINNLKLSRAIVSEWIEVKSIDVEERTITIWITEFPIETSRKSFTVPIKNENQIEIDDFKY